MQPDSGDLADVTLAHCATLPVAAVDALFARYGKPLDVTAELAPTILLADGSRLGRLRYRSPVDVIANDWFVRVSVDGALAIPGPLFAAAVARLTAPRT